MRPEGLVSSLTLSYAIGAGGKAYHLNRKLPMVFLLSTIVSGYLGRGMLAQMKCKKQELIHRLSTLVSSD